MTKADLIRKIIASTGLEKEAVSAVVEGIISGIKDSLINGEPVYLRGFGTFKNVTRKAKPARDIMNKTTVIIPGHRAPVFKPCKELKDSVK